VARAGRKRSGEIVRSFDPEALRRLREERGLSHDSLGAMVRVARPNLIGYEKGRERPGIEVLGDLARALGVDPLALTTATSATATLADLRARAGLSKSALAARVGLGRYMWDQIERGKRALQPDVAAKAAEALGVSARTVRAALKRGIEQQATVAGDRA
jgi:transcriptional regulator with XRE-family HTH domain